MSVGLLPEGDEAGGGSGVGAAAAMARAATHGSPHSGAEAQGRGGAAAGRRDPCRSRGALPIRCSFGCLGLR